MASPTPNLGMTYPAHGGAVNAWDTPLNTDFDTLDSVIGGKYTFSGAGGSSGSTLSQAQANVRLVRISGVLTVQDYLITFPAIGGLWIIDNQTTGNFNVKAKVTGSAATSVTCSRGVRTPVSSDGTDLTLAVDSCLFAIPFAGNPNASVAGTAATAYNPPSMVWDYTNNLIYMCTTSGNAAAAVWTNPSATVNRGFDTAINLEISATHTGGNLLNVAIKNSAGADPTSGSPVTVEFQTLSGSNTTGANTVVNITGALSMDTHATGASLGASANVAFRYWLALFNNGGTAVLAMRNCSDANNIYPIAEYGVDTTVAISSGATSAGVWYTPFGTTLTNKAFRVIGYLEYTALPGLVTPGTYASDPTNTVIFGPGIKLPGELVQSPYAQNGVLAGSAVNYTPSATPPTTAAAQLAVSKAIVPTSKANLIQVHGQAAVAGSVSNPTYTAFIHDGSTVLAAVGGGTGASATSFTLTAIPLTYRAIANGTASVTYSIYATVLSGTVYVNGQGAVQFYGSAANSFIQIDELMG